MATVTIIELFPITEDCFICGDVSIKKGIPMYEDIILHNDYDGEWGGRPACDRCFEIQSLIREPITMAEFKRRYTHQGEQP